jgi:anti-sigma factor RsiW
MKPCEHWRETLGEHALGSAADPELAEHLRKCAACSAALAKMQSLTREIDAGVRRLVAEEPEANGAARIVAEVDARAEQDRWLPTGRAIAAAFTAVVFLAASLGVLWRLRVQREDAERALSVAARISSWKSPTQKLLRSPYESELKGTPRLGEGFYRLDSGGVRTDNSAPRAKEKQRQ